MKKLVIILVTLSVCLASGNIQKQMDNLMKSLQDKYQIYGPADLHKLKTQQPTQHERAASRDMGDLVGDWIVEEESNELFITVGADQSIANPFSMMALMEAEGSITATAADYQTELTYLLDGEMMEDGDDSGDDCDMNCYGEYDQYMNDGSDVSNYYCECCHEDYPINEICEDSPRDYSALTYAQDYVNDNSSDYGVTTFDLESEFSLVVDGNYVSGGLGGDDPENCEINWPTDPFKLAVYSFVSEYVLDEGGSVGCFLDSDSLDQTYADFVTDMENQWDGNDDDDDGDDDDDDDTGSSRMIMNMNLMEFFMVMFGADPDSLNIQNPTILALESSNDNDTLDIIEGIMFGETGVIELMADSAEAVAATSMDTLNLSFTFTNLSLYDSTETVALTVSGTIAPGSIDFIAGVEQVYPFLEGMEDMFEDGEDDYEAYMVFYEDSTGMEIEVEYYDDEYYYDYPEIHIDTSYFLWSATPDSLFLYEEDEYYYDGFDTTEMAYYFMNQGTDTLVMEASLDACEGEDSLEECLEFASEEIAGLDELEDLQSLRLSVQRVLTPGSYTAVDHGNGSLPQDFNLYANYPNPFNPVTTIRFDVGQNSGDNTLLRIYDITGRSVATLISGQLQTGNYEIQWDARGFASGIYFSELTSGTKRHTQKMVLLK